MKKCDYCQHVEMCGWRKSLEERGCDFFDDGNKWILVSERLPEAAKNVLVTSVGGYVYVTRIVHGEWEYGGVVVAWMPLPKPYKAQSEETDERG